MKKFSIYEETSKKQKVSMKDKHIQESNNEKDEVIIMLLNEILEKVSIIEKDLEKKESVIENTKKQIVVKRDENGKITGAELIE